MRFPYSSNILIVDRAIHTGVRLLFQNLTSRSHGDTGNLFLHGFHRLLALVFYILFCFFQYTICLPLCFLNTFLILLTGTRSGFFYYLFGFLFGIFEQTIISLF